MIISNLKKAYSIINQWLEKYLILLVLAGFGGGIYGASRSQGFIDGVNNIVETFMDWYSILAPIAIFVILAPSLTKMLLAKQGKFGAYVIRWYALRKILACTWAVLFIALLLRLPFAPQESLSIWAAVKETMGNLGQMMVTSSYFYAMYLSILVAFISTKVNWLANLLSWVLDMVEEGGKLFLPIIPVFMVAIGGYIYALPQNIAEQVNLDGAAGSILQPLNIWGWQIDPATGLGMLWIYIVGALVTAVGCFVWHFGFLLLTRKYEKKFTIKGYFKNYWIKVYPLLWATSSEALATPLNLYLTKRHAPWVRDNIRRFVIGIGSYMNINGTLINVITLGAIVLSILGYPISILELLLIIPVVFLISYGVPGIPGELVLFAGPIATMLGLNPTIMPIFLAIYIGLQIGLPDSFRTGNNSTDDYVAAILVNNIYTRKFATDEKADEEAQGEIETLPETA